MPQGRSDPDGPIRLGSTYGRYRLDALLGRGGMGVVFRATDTELERSVAIKFLSPELAEDEAFRERFVRESRLAAAIEHPAIVPIYEAGTMGDSLFIAMRYVRGQDLASLLRTEAPLEVERTLALLGPVADALDAAHRRGLVHRDVKPANVLVDRSDGERAYLTDFGLSRRMGEPTGASRSGLLGTIDYASPEQVQAAAVDGRSDQYSLACLAMHCLTGSPPFDADSDAAVLYAHAHTEPPRLSERMADLAALDEPLARALSKAPDDRFPDCGSFVRALSTAAGIVPTTDAPPDDEPVAGAAEASGRPGRRTLAAAAIAGAAVVVVAAFTLSSGLLPPGSDVDRTMTPASPLAEQAAGGAEQERSAVDLRPGEVIVFASDRDGDYDLYAITAGDAGPRKLRGTSQDERSPAVSPDGETIAYVVGVEPSRDIWLMDSDGRNARRLTSHPADDADPAWSPDGRRLAFSSRRSDPTFDIWEIRDGGSGLRESNARNLTARPAVEQNPSWGPDSRELAIASNHFGGNRDIFRMEAGASDVGERLTSTDAFDFRPAFSPDGRAIAFYRRPFCETCQAERGPADVFVMDRDGRSLRRLTNTSGRDETDPDWAPDGRALVYAVGPDGAAELATMTPAGGSKKRLTNGFRNAIEPSWGVLP